MKMEFDFEGDEMAVVSKAIWLYSKVLATRAKTPEILAEQHALRRFIERMQPVVLDGMREENEARGRLN